MKHKIKHKKKHWDLTKFIPFVLIAGILISVELIVVYYTANFVPEAAPSFCTLNAQIDCDAVARTNFSLLFGIPNALWGLGFYVFALILYYAKSLKNLPLLGFMKIFKNPVSYIFVLSIFGIFFSIYLGYIMMVKIQKICLLCDVLYIVNILLFIVSKNRTPIIDHIITSINDFLKAISEKAYAIAVVLVAILGLSALIVINKVELFVPPEKSIFSKDIIQFQATTLENDLGSPDAAVIINEFTDVQCPFCAISNKMMHKIVDEYDNVRVLHHDLPLDTACNPSMTNQMHKNSCLYAQYALAAKKQGKYWGLLTKMFENNTSLTEDKVLEYAKELGLDTKQLKKDAYSKEVKEQLKEDIETTLDMKIYATPTYSINGKKYEGVFQYNELEKLVKELGAKKKVGK
ncbi:MAG: vitamin K epoxide reductase family protein [Candidatus Gastranaerophilales bacterium]|nr:vitamin K epoxide reductase family protein [Candidatus Gastranaerophilales bacterium]